MIKKLLLIILLSLFCQTIYATDMDSGLVGWWKLQDNAANTTVLDSSGNANTGTATNNTSTMHVAGKVGQGALSFNGSTQYISVANSSHFNFSGSNAMTIASWVYYNGSDGIIVQRGYTCVDFGQFALKVLSGKLNTFYGNANSGAGQKILAGSTSLTSGNWYHMVSVLNGTNITLYLNGVQDSTASTFSGNLWNATATLLYIGAFASTGGCGSPAGAFLNATLDDVRIYNRALSAADVANLYKYTGRTEGFFALTK